MPPQSKKKKKKSFTLHTLFFSGPALLGFQAVWNVGPSSQYEKHLTYMHLIRKWSPGWQAGDINQLVQLTDCLEMMPGVSSQLKSLDNALKCPSF